ncbi:MAG TPA: histone deacetylase [Tepidisphaeraceae bacterium]|jgi:acetoin utilization deacetylase AcuC-like enzyme
MDSNQRRMRCFSSPAYFAVLPAGHPFPMRKFPDSAERIRTDGIAEVVDPGTIDDADLLRVHTPAYVESIRTGRYNELTALRLGLPWHPTINTRSRAATAGTLAATRAALKDGIAANLAGGTHHAFADRGEGYCVFNDVAVAVRRLWCDEPWLHVMVIDLDAHQGNGTAALFAGDARAFTYSLHVGRNYPSRKEISSLDVEVSRYAGAEEYFDKLESTLPGAIERFEPDLVFYNAGVDVHEDDRFGQMKLTTVEMKRRDLFAIHAARRWEVPTVVVYGGGYNRTDGMTANLHVQTVKAASVFHQISGTS